MPQSSFLDHLRASLSRWSPLGERLVVAVSGGPDSVAMLRGSAALIEGKTALVVAHLNHGLRPQTADRDERFVADLAGRLGLRLACARIDLPAEARRRRQSVETVARDCRYEFLSRTAESLDARFVAVGHTADDQAETILHRILRGTGLKGLAGMPVRRALSPSCELVRPLLAVPRSDVLAYLTAINQPYCDDETNADSGHTRNRLRNELLPLLEREFNPRVREALQRLGRLAADAQQVIDEQADDLFRQAHTSRNDAGCALRLGPLIGCPPHLLRAVLVRLWQEMGWGLREIGFEELDRTATVICGGANGLTLPGKIDVRRRGDRVEFRAAPRRSSSGSGVETNGKDGAASPVAQAGAALARP
jgi:tRNA(Ile)-lysidine synthase